jgi:hypothetical protein
VDLRDNPLLTEAAAAELAQVILDTTPPPQISEINLEELLCQNLQVLDLQGCGLGNLEGCLLAEIIHHGAVPALSSVDLRGNTELGDHTAERFAAALLSNNSPDLDMVSAIPLSILQHGASPELDLRGQALGNFEAALIAALLEHNSMLRLLDLRQNVIGEVGARSLGVLLSKDTKLSAQKPCGVQTVLVSQSSL